MNKSVVQQVILILFIFNISTKSENVKRSTQRWKYKPPEWDLTPPFTDMGYFVPSTTPGVFNEAARQGGGDKNRHYIEATFSKASGRTTQHHVSAHEPCDYIVLTCLRAYQTGKVCGRTSYYRTMTFKNYCMLTYANCILRYEYFVLAHMGECFRIYPGPPGKGYKTQPEQKVNYKVMTASQLLRHRDGPQGLAGPENGARYKEAW
ncbi:uncharacterized protein LOC118270716 isoform X2 [Spodoptera frugiperda]|uniref:Uncharacterized protein LOC118270716 isoform X2 n=1 Tax=Spodoptera frugiperda TaxID=7108 RepID=A0A9R0DUV9_SPOFR|nr:uncharacterized protein LOC118270716 isoform X2 [Spodoptera frugiperda]